MLKFLIEAFKASKGRMPNNMEMILLKQKAAKQSIDERKVVSMFDRSAVNPNKPILGGKNIPETEDEIRRRLMKQNEEGIASMKSKLEDPEKKADGGRIGLKGGADAATESFSKSAGSSRKGRSDPKGGFNLSGGQGPTFGGAPPTTGGGGGGNDNNQTSTTPTISSPTGSPFTRSTMPPSGLMSNISPSILARLARMSKGLKPVLGKDLGLEYETIDDLNDVLTNFKITQDIEDLIKTQKINPELKYKKEIGDNTFFDVGINKEGDANIIFKKQFAEGGRAGYKFGTGKKGVEGLLDLIRNKFGKKSITTADKASTPSKTLERDMFKKADENFKNKRMLTDDEYQDFLDEVGGADQLEAYDFDGTVGDAKRIIREQKRYMDDMELEYKKGNLDPKPGEKGRKEFLQKKLDEVEASGDQRLMTPDEIEELSSLDSDSQMDVVKTLAPKMVERLQLKKKYPGITDDLLDKILIDDNVQRKAEVLATIDEAFKMMEKGKSADEILDTMKNVTRTKQADGGIMRANFVGGGMGRRGFLKMLAGLGGGIAAAKTGLLKFAGKEPVKQVAKEVVQKSTTGSPPPYFFKLAEKIKMLGDDATATTDRTIAKTLKSKDGKSTYVLEEDVATGDTIIKKVNKEGDEMITDVEIMELKKGEVVMGKNGKPVKVPDEYEEVTEVNARIEGDTFNDPYYSDGIKIDEIMKEVGEQAPSIKKADGGIMRAGYQTGGDVSYDATDPIYGSSAATFTPATVMDQFGNQVQSEMGNNFNKPLIPQVTEQASKQEGIMNSSPVASQLDGTGEVDMPIAGGNNNASGILPVMPQDNSPTDMRYRDPGPGIGTGDKIEAVKYNEPLPKDQLLSGFEEYVRNNPYSGAGTTAIKKAILPGGYEYTFSGSQEANKFNEYLASIGQAPYQAQQDPTMLVKFASGGIARMLGE